MVNFKDEDVAVAEAVVERAASKNRSVSYYLARLAEQDLKKAGLIPQDNGKKTVKLRGRR